jgi:hypothetical protein
MPDDLAAQTALDAAIANANRCEQAGDHAGRAAAATAALKLKEAAYRPVPSATPTDASGAAARLAHLEKDSAWVARYFAGDPQAQREFKSLTERLANTDDVTRAVQGADRSPFEFEARTSGAEASVRDMVAAFDHFRAIGGEQDVAVLEGFMGNRQYGYDPAEHELAKQVHAELTSSPDFLKKLAAKDPFVTRMFHRASMVLSAGVDSSLPRNPQTERLLEERWTARYRDGRIT